MHPALLVDRPVMLLAAAGLLEAVLLQCIFLNVREVDLHANLKNFHLHILHLGKCNLVLELVVVLVDWYA